MRPGSVHTKACLLQLRRSRIRGEGGARVRRQVKAQDDSLSLLRILSQIKDCAPQLTFDFFLKLFPRDPEYVPWQEPTFKNISADGRVASAGLINGDIEEIKRLTAEIEAYADRALAHLDKRGYDGKVTSMTSTTPSRRSTGSRANTSLY